MRAPLIGAETGTGAPPCGGKARLVRHDIVDVELGAVGAEHGAATREREDEVGAHSKNPISLSDVLFV